MAVVEVSDMAQIPRCCGCGGGQKLQLQFNPLAWELPFGLGVALKGGNKNLKRWGSCPGAVVNKYD